MPSLEQSIFVVGAGGHGRVVADVWLAMGKQFTGFVDLPEHAGKIGWRGLPIWHEAELLRRVAPADALLLNGIGSVSSTALRKAVYLRLSKAGYRFDLLTHPTAIVCSDVALGAGVQLMAGAIVQTGARIGINTIINTGAIVDHDCVVGDHCHIAPGAVLSGGVEIGSGSHIGCGASLIQGIKIGEGALVAAGAVVTRNVGAGGCVAGVPARALRRN